MKKIVIGSIVVLVLLGVGIVVGWSRMQANALRSKVYQPLYKEVTAAEEVVLASSLSRAVPSTVYLALKKDPLWEQVPPQLRKDVQDTYDKVWDCQSEMVVVRAHVSGVGALAVKLVRKEADDQAWIKRIANSAPAPAAKGKWPRREAVVDRSDPAHPRVTVPGGPMWRLQDWLGFPDNVAELDQQWGEEEFLFLTDNAIDRWDNRITHDDLRRAHLTLEQFMANLDRSILSMGRMQGYRQYCRASATMLATLKKQLEEKSR